MTISTTDLDDSIRLHYTFIECGSGTLSESRHINVNDDIETSNGKAPAVRGVTHSTSDGKLGLGHTQRAPLHTECEVRGPFENQRQSNVVLRMAHQYYRKRIRCGTVLCLRTLKKPRFFIIGRRIRPPAVLPPPVPRGYRHHPPSSRPPRAIPSVPSRQTSASSAPSLCG